MQTVYPKLDAECGALWAHDTHQMPVSPRVAIHLGSAVIGTVAQSFLDFLQGTGQEMGWTHQHGPAGHTVHLPKDPALTFAAIRRALQGSHTGELAPAESLSLFNENGQVLASFPRDIARFLGIDVHSVHLVGWQANACWVQERAAKKLEDPWRLDTMVGGTVAFGEEPLETLERETREEAGLSIHQLQELTSLGSITLRYPDPDVRGWGYRVETVHCFSATLGADIHPINLDGEVAAFHRLTWPELARAMVANRFSLAALGVLLHVTQSAPLARPLKALGSPPRPLQ